MEPSIPDLVRDALGTHSFPGIVLLVHRGNQELLRLVAGTRQEHPAPESMTQDTLFDLASVTKPLATALLVHHVTERDGIDLDRSLEDFLPHGQNAAGHLSLRQLLLHVGGLPPIPELQSFFPVATMLDRGKAIRHLLAIAPDSPPGQQVVYSCTGFQLLGVFLETVTGLRLGKLFRQVVATPLGLNNLLFNPPRSEWHRVAATEFCPWRGHYVKGEVHDESSFCLGGDGGNAGLFGTADEVMTLLGLLAGEGRVGDVRLLSEEQVSLMRTCASDGMGRRRGHGFTLKDEESPIGDALGPRSYGHTGFTGTSVWVDPDSDLRVVTLTNRVHLGRDATDEPIRRFRRALHKAVERHWG